MRPKQTLNPIKIYDRISGCLYGGAVGDALGYSVEFDSIAEIYAEYGLCGITEPVDECGFAEVSDDTQMTLFTLEAILRARSLKLLEPKLITVEIRKSYLDWYSTQLGALVQGMAMGALSRHKVLHKQQAPGANTMEMLGLGAEGCPEKPIGNSAGCGAVMRVAPVGFMTALGFPAGLESEVALHSAALTHGHRNALWPSVALAIIIAGLVAGDDLDAAISAAKQHLNSVADARETLSVLDKAFELRLDADGDSHPHRIGRLGQGWVGHEALAIAIYAVASGTDYKQVIQIAANHDGDSDSTASIAGQIYGAWKGIGAIPEDWIERLDIKRTMEFAVNLIQTWV